jgi:putative component of membrane protein insertase Oxa1/YidC/SpoIIIJ protein YidD
MSKIVIKLIEFYSQYLSFDRGVLSVFAPGGACKYSHTCSVYTRQMVKKYGVVKGLILGGKRILTCR